jgi:tRNA(Ile)-lysidine synthase
MEQDAVGNGITLNKAFAEAVRAKWPPGCRYLAAVSGGRDSMAMLHFLDGAGYRDLIVCQIDHGLRGEASRGEAGFVRETAVSYGYPVELRAVDVATFSRSEKLSLETAARELRYRAFAEIAKKHHCPRLFLAHHADDRVETVLINLFRGTGSKGLAGIEPQTSRVVAGVELEMIRPLLSVTRDEIIRYVEKEGIAYLEDESNASDFALRNRVRNRLLPLLGEIFGRDVRPAVLRAADLAALDEAWATEATGPLPWRGENGGLDVAALRLMTEGQRQRVLLIWLRESGVPDCGHDEVARAQTVLMAEARPARASLPADHQVRRREGILFIERRSPA